MIKISLAIHEGAIAFLKREYKAAGIVAIFLFLVLWVTLGFKIGLGFLIGAVASALAGFIGMMVSTGANVKVAEAAKKGLAPALNLSFRGGSVTGLLVIGLGLLSVSGFWALTHDLKSLVALGFGGSLISVFARLGGGIYTKGADVGADLVGKIEKGIPEDDPRNPAVIADNVGDNVGDCAGMAADIFETYIVTIVAAILIGTLIFSQNSQIILFPLILASIGILASIIATYFVKLGKNQSIMGALYKSLIVSGVLAAAGFWPVIKSFSASFYQGPAFQNLSDVRLYFSAIVGLVIAAGVFIITDYHTSRKYRPVKNIAKASQAGHAINIIVGLAEGMKATALPIILISAGILTSFWLAGIYGIAIAAVAMLSLAGIIVAIDSYGPITDNAGGIAEMAGLSEDVRKVTDSLDA
ncbi:unnamed protein product, partial [marine sediment metagenome]